jgi:uncharacterized protein
MIVTALNRYAVKGLSGDALSSVGLASAAEAFPDDRRFALLQRRHLDEFQEQEESRTLLPWLHKEKFLCAFTDPALLARLRTAYSIRSPLVEQEMLQLSRGYPNDAPVFVGSASSNDAARGVGRVLTVRDRASGVMLLPELDLSRADHRDLLQDFMSEYSGRDVVCVTATASDDETKRSNPERSASALGTKHAHQFGNTSSGYKQREDTRTVHIVTQQTVDALSSAAEADAALAADAASSRRPPIRLHPNRFRPNIVVDGGSSLAPFEEFQWIGRRIQVVKKASGNRDTEPSGLELSVIAKTVRCRGVSVDPDDWQGDGAFAAVVDVPDLLVRHFPEHGPYLGVYAVVERPGTISLGDELSVLPLN